MSTIGIRHLWVQKVVRRKGVAKRLCDVCRKNFFFGRLVSKKEIAFSQPTADGMNFALSYVGGTNFFGYS